MVAFGVQTLRELVQGNSEPCVSFYVPLGAGPETEESRIRVKNLLRQAEEALLERGFRRPEVDKLLKAARPVLETARDSHPRDAALAALIAPGQLYEFQLPYKCDPLSVVGERFHIKPLILGVKQDRRYYLLALAQNDVRLYEGDRVELRPVHVPNLPANINEAVPPTEAEKSVQWHTRTPWQSGRRSPMFFGPSDVGSDQIARLQHFCGRVDAAVCQFLGDRQEPLILAAVDFLQPIYRSVSRYARLLPQGIEGNPEPIPIQQLHAQAWAIAEPEFRAAELKHLELLPEAISKNRGSTDLAEILSGAANARVAELSIAVDRHQWGRFDPETGELHIAPKQSPQNEDLLNLAAIHTLKHGGTVHAVSSTDLPDASAAAAIFRF